MKCCTVTAKTLSNPEITVEYKDLTLRDAKLITHFLTMAFRSVDCINQLTGEVMQNFYVSDEFFVPISRVDECLASIEKSLNAGTMK